MGDIVFNSLAFWKTFIFLTNLSLGFFLKLIFIQIIKV